MNIRVLHIAECAGGVERYLQMLLPRLEKRGLKQFFICSRNYDECIYRKMVDGVKGLLKSCPVKYMVYRDDRPKELKQLDVLHIEDFLCVMHPVINTNKNRQ